MVPPTPIFQVSPTFAIPGNLTDVQLTCGSLYLSVSNFTFFKNNSVIYYGVKNTLTLRRVGVNDTATYSCKVTIDGLDSDLSDPVIFIVYSKYCLQTNSYFEP